MILVTGATGIIGHFIAHKLVEAGHKVRATRREGSDTTRLDPWKSQIEWVNAELDDLEALQKAFDGIERVIHCAAVVSFHQQDKEEMFRVNIGGTANIINLAIENNIKKFVHISSVAALGRKNGQEVIDEDSIWEDSNYNSNYAESKHLGEMEVWRGQEEGLPTVILNPSTVLGPGKWNSSSMQLFNYVNQGRKFYPIGHMNYVDVRDVAQIAIDMLFNEIAGEKFILNAGKAPYQEILGLISDNLNKPKPTLKVSYSLLIFAFVLDTIRSFVTRQKSILTRESMHLSKMDFLFSNSKIIEVLDYKFHSLEESIVWTCKELKNGIID